MPLQIIPGFREIQLEPGDQNRRTNFKLMIYLWTALGSAIGGTLRLWLTLAMAKAVPDFPAGTLVVNVSGSFLIGMVHAWLPAGHEPGSGSELWRTFLMAGVLGGYTTFSSFSLQTLQLARDQQWLAAGGNVVLSVVLCLVAVVAGAWFGGTVGAR